MTQEQKAIAYDEAIDKVACFIKKHIGFGCMIHPNSSEAKELFNIFPELKESEGERIRKRLHSLVNDVSGELLHKYCITKEEALTWLEKQNSNVDNANKEYWRGYREGKQEILDKYAELEKQGEQKTVWSEEDENRINRLIAYFEDKESFTAEDDIVYANWLKSLRLKKQWKPSEEQIKALHDINLTGGISYAGQGQLLIELYNNLKELTE